MYVCLPFISCFPVIGSISVVKHYIIIIIIIVIIIEKRCCYLYFAIEQTTYSSTSVNSGHIPLNLQ
jgi:hypothetical protein